ncbi:MAG: ferritin family protein [Candidatus Altiarchaeota archaeon]
MEFNALEVLETAMRLEKDGLRFYKQASEMFDDTLVKSVFKKLAEDEKHHLDTLEAQYESLARFETWMVFQELYKGDEESEAVKPKILDEEKLHHMISDGMTPKQAVKVGIKLEEDSLHYYSKNARDCDEEQGREMFKKLVEFEKQHLDELKKLLKKMG